ncbi:hypothetical protein, partial [uncultured Bosea sp.]|uniref:hypothetical protein n=1 Tax=uncultured Bosea sp. TaxID=211457 RepID=UPI00263AADDE
AGHFSVETQGHFSAEINTPSTKGARDIDLCVGANEAGRRLFRASFDADAWLQPLSELPLRMVCQRLVEPVRTEFCRKPVFGSRRHASPSATSDSIEACMLRQPERPVPGL